MTRFAREVAPGRIRRCGLESSLDGSGPRSKCITVYISSCPHPLLMLAPRASSAFVCLRCELKLARPRISPLASQSSHASFSTSARRQDGADETQTQTQTLTPSEAHVPKGDRESDGKESVLISKEYTRQGRLHRKAKLGMKRMDEDADVLVLNDAPMRNESEPKEPEVLEPISVPDIISSLEHDSAPATQEDVEKQLESLRPSSGNPDEPQYVTTADFVKLVAALTRGFTSAQLSGYYSTAKSIKKGSVYKVVKATVRATKRSQWYPTTTNIEKRLPDVEATSGKKQKTKSIRKATLVDKILRDVWKLELLEELEAPGELELRLKDWQLKLLQSGGTCVRSRHETQTDFARRQQHPYTDCQSQKRQGGDTLDQQCSAHYRRQGHGRIYCGRYRGSTQQDTEQDICPGGLEGALG